MTTIRLAHTKSTKGTHVFEALPNAPAAIPTLYIQRWAFPTMTPPKFIEVTIKEVSNVTP